MPAAEIQWPAFLRGIIMADFFSQNWGTLLAGGIVLLIVFFIVRNMVIRKRNGEHIVDCGGDCGSCGGSCGSAQNKGGKAGKTAKGLVPKKGETGLIKTVLSIDGMMCGMCETHINDAVRNNFKVKNVYSSHKKGETVILSKEAPDEGELRKVIENTGYELKSVVSEAL